MNTKIGLLASLVLLQLILIAILWFSPDDNNDEAQLLSFEVSEVDRIVIGDGADQNVDIAKQDGVWFVAGVPADANKVTEVLTKLANLDAPWPVATSGSSADRFEVSADNHQRRVQLFTQTAVTADLYLGTSPGYQRVHARRADTENIYSVALSNFEFEVNSDIWIDKSVLAMAQAPDEISVMFLDDSGSVDTRLVNTGEGWLFNDVAADQTVAVTYANRFTTLQVLGLADSMAGAQAIADISLQNEGASQVLRISKLAAEGDYLISVEGADSNYRVATYIAEQLLMTDVDFLPALNQPQQPLEDNAILESAK